MVPFSLAVPRAWLTLDSSCSSKALTLKHSGKYLAKAWRARCETNVNQLQEYKSGGTKWLRNHGIHVAETLLRLCRKLTRDGHLQLRCMSGRLGMCIAKSWRARCETNVNQLQEYKSGGAKSFRNHGIHVAEIRWTSCGSALSPIRTRRHKSSTEWIAALHWGTYENLDSENNLVKTTEIAKNSSKFICNSLQSEICVYC
jgi:hypothetical protein